MRPGCPYEDDVANILSDSRHIRACIVLSFLVQAFLTIFAPLRKCLGGKWGIFFSFLIWLAYLIADWTAIFTIGSISLITLIRRYSDCYDINVYWFWAAFLLLHLGGPDTITAYGLQDNELWLRHLLGLIFQVGSTLYVFLVSLPDNNLWRPTLLVLIAGIIKYAERIYAFYLASFDHFGDNWVRGEKLDFYLPIEEGTTSTDQKEERTAGTHRKEGAAGLRIPVQFKNLGTSDRLHKLPKKVTVGKLSSEGNNFHQYFAASDPNSIVKAAVYLFGTIRRPLVGSLLSSAQLWKSFANLGSQNEGSSAKEALRKIEIELSLLYEVLHTKWPVVVSKFGFLCRALDIGCIGGAFVLFSLSGQFWVTEFDTPLTYGLLIGALALDFISLILLFFLSDWFFIAYFHEKGSKSVENFISRRRWSKTVSQLNFITCVVNGHPSWVKKCFSSSYPSLVKRWAKRCLSWVKKWPRWMKRCLSMCLCLYWVEKCLSWVKKRVRVKMFLSPSSQNFREDTYWCFIFGFIFEQLTRKKKKEEEESISERRPISIRPNINVEWFTMIIDILEKEKIDGEVILGEEKIDEELSHGDPFKDRLKYPLEDPEQNIHTEISLEDLFEDPAQNGTEDNNRCLRQIMRQYDFTRSLLILHIATELFLQDGPPTLRSSSGSNDHRGTCKILSDYLFYLAMMKSAMLAPMLHSWEKVFGDTYEEAKSVLKLDSIEENACKKILSHDFHQAHSRRKDPNRSVLILARDLARALKRKRYRANGYDQYDDLCEKLSRVWVCLLAHAASNCRPNVHAKQLRKGGELLTFIWLCIANCGDREVNSKMFSFL